MTHSCSNLKLTTSLYVEPNTHSSKQRSELLMGHSGYFNKRPLVRYQTYDQEYHYCNS